MHLHKVEPNVNERVWFISYSLLELFKKLMKFTILQKIFFKKKSSTSFKVYFGITIYEKKVQKNVKSAF